MSLSKVPKQLSLLQLTKEMLILSFLIIVLHKSQTTQAKTPYFQAIQNWNNDHTY